MTDTIVRRAGEQGITPFWNRIPRFFLYALSPQPLLYMLGLAAVTALGWFVPLLGIPAVVLATLAFLRYCYSVLERVAFGQLSAAGHYASDYGRYRPWKQLVVFVVYGLVVGVTAVLLGTVPAYVVQYAVLLLLPANVMWLGLTNSLLASLNVARLVRIVQAIGWPYLALYVFLMLLSIAANTLSFFAAVWLEDTVFVFPAVALAQMYFTLIAFNMLGYAVYQYHDRLGYRVAQDEPKAPPSLGRRVREAQRDDKALDAQIKRLLDAGRNREATDLLYDLVRLNPENRSYNERYRAVLRSTGNKLALLRHGAPYIDELLKAADRRRALEIFRESRQIDASFNMPEGSLQLRLADAALMEGAADTAVELVQRFDELYPLSPERPAAYLLGARLLHERFGAPEEARRLLEEILRRHPKDPLAAEAWAYLSRLSNDPGAR
ncbi:MAG TPA: hypothetical protein VFU53_11120 [Burkholderiales bacterium]|nr:hypothetical protein [Burkholderiales bacterium]